ncbi:MAG: addiction module protein [Pseudomonadota bacterium]
MSVEELQAEAMKLSPEARARLAHALLLSLDELSDADIEELWMDEAIRRDEEIDAGTTELRSADEVFRSARRCCRELHPTISYRSGNRNERSRGVPGT